jgi:hypothetical protein
MEPSYGGGLFDMVKGGAGRLFSNLKDNLKDTLKDTSSRVIQSVARYAYPSWLGEWGPMCPRDLVACQLKLFDSKSIIIMVSLYEIRSTEKCH